MRSIVNRVGLLIVGRHVEVDLLAVSGVPESPVQRACDTLGFCVCGDDSGQGVVVAVLDYLHDCVLPEAAETVVGQSVDYEDVDGL